MFAVTLWRLVPWCLVCFFLLACGGHQLAPVFNPQGRVPPALSDDTPAIQRAIELAVAERGWSIESAEPGAVVATIQVRQHLATVVIEYDRERFQITYEDSDNLLYDGDRIHRNDNRWVNNLRRDIEVQLLRME